MTDTRCTSWERTYLRISLCFEARIERVAQTVAEKVVGQHDEGHDGARVHREHRCREYILLRILQHVAPRRRGRLNAQSKIADRRLRQDREGYTQARGDHQRG